MSNPAAIDRTLDAAIDFTGNAMTHFGSSGNNKLNSFPESLPPQAQNRLMMAAMALSGKLQEALGDPPAMASSTDVKAALKPLSPEMKLEVMAFLNETAAMVLKHKIDPLDDLFQSWPVAQLDAEIVGVLRDNKLAALEKVAVGMGTWAKEHLDPTIDIGPLPPQRSKKPRHGPKP